MSDWICPTSIFSMIGAVAMSVFPSHSLDRWEFLRLLIYLNLSIPSKDDLLKCGRTYFLPTFPVFA